MTQLPRNVWRFCEGVISKEKVGGLWGGWVGLCAGSVHSHGTGEHEHLNATPARLTHATNAQTCALPPRHSLNIEGGSYLDYVGLMMVQAIVACCDGLDAGRSHLDHL